MSKANDSHGIKKVVYLDLGDFLTPEGQRPSLHDLYKFLTIPALKEYPQQTDPEECTKCVCDMLVLFELIRDDIHSGDPEQFYGLLRDLSEVCARAKTFGNIFSEFNDGVVEISLISIVKSGTKFLTAHDGIRCVADGCIQIAIAEYRDEFNRLTIEGHADNELILKLALRQHVAEKLYSWLTEVDTEELRLLFDIERNRLRKVIPALTKKPEHAPDFSTVDWYGKPFVFTSKQAAAVELLWKTKAGLKGDYVVTEIESPGRTLPDIFKNRDGKCHPAWRSMIVSAGKGIYRIAFADKN